MKIIREHVRLQSGVVTFAYVKANWFERRALDRMMRDGRHNLRPAHNYTGPRKVGASYIIKPKGRPNPDPGRMLGPSSLATWLLKKEFNNLDGIGISIATAAAWYELYVAAGVTMGVFIAASIYLQDRFKEWL